MLFFSIALSLQLLSQGVSASNSVELEAPVTDNTYTYNPFGKRDPFKSYLSEKKGGEAELNRDPLLNFDLSKFTLVGIVWGFANPKAIVKDGDNRGHIISRGTKIGRNRGSVIRILKDEVIVSEEFRDPLGKLIVSEYSLKMEKKEASK